MSSEPEPWILVDCGVEQADIVGSKGPGDRSRHIGAPVHLYVAAPADEMRIILDAFAR